MGHVFVMAGGGTGGHVIPSVAVARELSARGHAPLFIGTQTGFEAKLVPQTGFPIEWIQIGGLKGVGLMRTLRTLWQLPRSVWRCWRILRHRRPAAVFSMGGYVAGPVMLAAWLRGTPIVLMEPNAMPGLTARRMANLVARALVGFPEALPYFPKGRTEVTGLPVRAHFFELPAKPFDGRLTVLITGGSRGSRTLNEAARASFPLLQPHSIRILLQTGTDAYESVRQEFAATGLDGEVAAFFQDMPALFAQADLVVCRSGAGAVAELAAAGKPAILVPFPFASDDHQLHNAESLARIGAARLVLDREMTGERLFQELAGLLAEPAELVKMGHAARSLARPHAAQRAAEILEDVAKR